MQLFILSPIILIPLWKWPKFTIPAIVFLILGSMGCIFGTFYINKYSLKLLSLSSTLQERMEKIYYATHTRMGAWLVGIILGYILNKTRETEIQISKTYKIIGWTISFATILAIIFGQYGIQQIENKENLLISALYDSCTRVSWAISISWIIFACYMGFGGIINWFLSLAFWAPLARLSYSIYLTHFVVQVVRVGSAKTNGYFSDVTSIETFWSDFGLTLTISVFWCLAFESPVVVLEKYLYSRGKLIFFQYTKMNYLIVISL